MLEALAQIDLNLDAGESWEHIRSGQEEALYQLVSSVNIACGGHAGDAESMKFCVKLAKKYQLQIGAHPSYPDIENFGRNEMNISDDDLTDSIESQILQLRKICLEEGVMLSHVKPHGALYNQAATDRGRAQAVIKAVQRIDPSLPIVERAGSSFLRWCRHSGGRAIAEAFSDRAYEKGGELRKRSEAGALIIGPDQAASQALKIASEKKVFTYDGIEIPMEAQTLCVHGDSAKALATARKVREVLTQAHILIRAF